MIAKNRRVRLLAACLAAVCLLSAAAQAAESSVVIGTGIPGRPEAEVPAQWDDAWFASSASIYRQELALTSMALSGAAYLQKDGESCAQDALRAFGFQKTQSHHYWISTEAGSRAAYTFGMKKVKDQQSKPAWLVAVVVRGTGEYTEWASNLNVGTGTVHEGFARACGELLVNLKKYLAEIPKKERGSVRFLITGHSRGGAVANLLAARLPAEGLAEENHVYGYTFAAPAVSTEGTAEGYENIFNIINTEDLVTQVPLSVWGYRRYGADLPLPAGNSGDQACQELFDSMNQRYRELTGEEYAAYRNPEAVTEITGALYRLVPSASGANMAMISALLSGDFEGLSALVKENGPAALLMGKTAMEASSRLTPLLQQEQNGLRSAHCMAGYYSWLEASSGYLQGSLHSD